MAHFVGKTVRIVAVSFEEGTIHQNPPTPDFLGAEEGKSILLPTGSPTTIVTKITVMENDPDLIFAVTDSGTVYCISVVN